jgi:hypothetical protein
MECIEGGKLQEQSLLFLLRSACPHSDKKQNGRGTQVTAIAAAGEQISEW